MRDVALMAVLLSFCWMAWRQPWTGVVGLAFLGILHPQNYGGTWLVQMPAYKILFIVTSVAAALDFLRRRRWPALFFDWRLVVMALLLVDFMVTTWFAILPDTARGRFIEVAMLFPPVLLALILLDTREKLFAAVMATAVGAALVAVKGGWWAVMTGFSDRVYGPPTSQIGGNNEFAVALAMVIPLLVFWRRQVAYRGLRYALAGLIGLCFVAALTSWSRGALVALVAMTGLLVLHSQRKVLAIVLLSLGVVLTLGIMPAKWQERMESISSYQSDQSFAGREEGWKTGLAYFKRDPWTGSGFDGWRYLTAELRGTSLADRAWHNAYVQMLAEHGAPGFALWCLLVLGTVVELTRFIAHGRRTRDPWLADFGAFLRASLVAYLVGGLTLGIATWELLFQLLAYALIARRFGKSPSETVGNSYSGVSRLA